MAQLLVRNIGDDVVKELKIRAARNGRSAEEEHREILRGALQSGHGGTLKEYLLTMPDVGDDTDFARPRDYGRELDL